MLQGSSNRTLMSKINCLCNFSYLSCADITLSEAPSSAPAFFLFIIIDRSKIQCIKVCSNLYLRTKGVTKSKAECGLWRASKTYNIYIFLLLCFSYLFLECFFFICLRLYNSFFFKFFRYLLDIRFLLLRFLTIFQY